MSEHNVFFLFILFWTIIVIEKTIGFNNLDSIPPIIRKNVDIKLRNNKSITIVLSTYQIDYATSHWTMKKEKKRKSPKWLWLV